MSTTDATSSPAITAFGATELAHRIAAGELSSVEVVEAHLTRIAEVNPRLKALTQPLFDEARQSAAEADAVAVAARVAGRSLPPLHGVPVSIKDSFDVRGTAVTLGFPKFNYVAGKDAPHVARLRAAGAILLGKTNVPQAMLLHECDNPRYGRTVHPLNEERSPGGSTGGEAALLAAGCSPLGLGSDLGGSIRQPAHACGVCGFKPTTGRVTLAGHYRPLAGMKAIAGQPGPLARRVEDVDLAMRVLTDYRHVPRQADELPQPWHGLPRVTLDGLRVGYWCEDGVIRTAPAIIRAMNEAAAALESRGMDVVPLEPPDMRQMMRIYFGLVSADGLRSIKRLAKGNRLNWQLRRQLTMCGLARAFRLPLSLLLHLGGQRILSALLDWSGPRSSDRYWQLTAEADRYRATFWQNIAVQAGGPVDALLLPPHALCAMRHGTALDLLHAAAGCYLPNLLDAPAGVVPWTVTRSEELALPGGFDLVEHLARQTVAGSAGLPVGVQVMAPMWRDEVVVALMRELEAATRGPTA